MTSPPLPSLTALLQGALKEPRNQPAFFVDEQTLEASRAHGVHLFLYQYLKSHKQIVSPEGLARIRTDYLCGVKASERRRVQAGDLLSALSAAGIATIPLKGIWLADHMYPEPADRSMNDLDFLVQRQNFSAAESVLRSAGYTSPAPGDRKHRLFTHPEWSLPVELHARLDQPGPLGLDPVPLWKRAVPSLCAGQPCLALDPHDLVLTLVRHVLFHSLGYYPLRSLLDIALILKQEGPALDLHALHQQAQAIRMVKGLAVILAMAEKLAGFEQEAEWPEAWRPEPVLLEEAWLLTLERGACRSHPPEPMLRLDNLRTWSARLRLLGGRLFLPRAELEARYPWSVHPGLRPFAITARLGNLIRLYAVALIRLARRDPAVLEALDVSRERRSWLARIYPDPPAGGTS
jgi:hypothetical protein